MKSTVNKSVSIGLVSSMSNFHKTVPHSGMPVAAGFHSIVFSASSMKYSYSTQIGTSISSESDKHSSNSI